MKPLTTTSQYEQIIPSSTGGSNDTGYGQNVAVNETYMAVSAVRYDVNGLNDSGCIYLYRLDEDGIPIEDSVTIISPSDAAADDLFGDPIKIIDNLLVTASFCKNSGEVYIYDLENNLSETIITAPSNSDYRFGCSFDMTADKQRLFIGSLGSDTSVAGSGVVYCYNLTNDGYELYNVIKPPVPIQNGGFGRYVEVSGDQLIIGSQNVSTVYVFDAYTLQLEDLIGASLPKFIDGLGVPIDVYNDVMVIGARDSFGGRGCGLVYQQENENNWMFQGIIFDKTLTSQGSGISVSIDENHIAISPKNTLFGAVSDQGSVTLYSYSHSNNGLDIKYESTYITDNGEPGDFFGKRVTLENGNLYSTALYDDNQNGTDAGSVYIIPIS